MAPREGCVEVTGQPLSKEREQDLRRSNVYTHADGSVTRRVYGREEIDVLLAEIDRLRAEVGERFVEYATMRNRLEAEVARLEAALALANENIRLRETTQIPVIPRGAQEKIRRLEAALAKARRLLTPGGYSSHAIWREKRDEWLRSGGQEQT